MKIVDTPLPELFLLEPKIFSDSRGSFVKVFNAELFAAQGLKIEIKESYYSISQKNVIRGMHFQLPPFDHTKLVYVPDGKIIDVVLDIRKNSSTFGQYFQTELSSENGKVIIIPRGFAHGFKALTENTNVTYLQTSVYSAPHDAGIHYDSFGFDWGVTNPILSERDTSFPPLDSFVTPF